MASTEAGSSQRVLVSLAGAPSIESSAKWKQVQSALRAQLPLRNIHWKSASHTSIRTIQELDVDLVPLDAPREEHSQIPVTLLEKPLLNIYVVVCQNTDLEGYKNTVKKQIRDWHSSVTTRKNQEWLIVHIVRPDTRTQTANFFQLKGSVLEKIKSDFNADKKERCVQVAWSPETDAPAVWAELVNKIKDGVFTAFDLAVAQREEEVRRSESQRQMPGWNFCVNLPEDAYAQYEELEMSFYHVVKEENLSWFGTLIAPVSGDDSAPLLSFQRKAYRDLILANTISIFDFRIYLLARQCELLAQRGRLNEISRKVAAFLVGFGRRLRDIEDTLPPYFIESWIYSSALSAVEFCDNWALKFCITGNKLNSFNAAKGELLDLARTQLDIIGVTEGHLPQKPPFSSSCTSTGQRTKTTSTLNISNSDLLEAIGDAEAFYQLYTDATNRAIDSGAELLMHEEDQVDYITKLVDSLHQAAGKLDSAAGTYLLDSSELRVAKLYLQWQHKKPSSKAFPARKETKVLVHVPKDLLALDVNISQPDRIELGEPPTILVAVSTGRNHVVKAFVKLTSSGVTFWPKDAYYDGAVEKRTERLQVVDNSIMLEDIPEHTTVSLMIPHSDTSAFQAMKITAEVEYMTAPEQSLSRTIRMTKVVLTTLPISVNVEDFFRGSRYREVEAVVDRTVAKVVADLSSPRQHRTALMTQLIEALERDAGWVDLYGITGELKVPDAPHDEENEETVELLRKAKELLKHHKHPSPPEGNWREIRIPVDVPYMNIVASVSVQILSTPFSNLSAKSGSLPLYAGQPISAMISIHTSFHWGPSAGEKGSRYILRYDVEEMVRDWLVSGPKRGDFTAASMPTEDLHLFLKQDGDTKAVPITLVALHHGELALPKVSVTALPISGESTMGSMAIPSTETFQTHGAETVLVLPRGGRSTFVINMGSNDH
ncbi:hypothetical protein C0993_002535 [Termitomyces sp. T159_Od127]|nr:hypothetical protein C0993_002535 [Termitomyces sp. T159_Od127]